MPINRMHNPICPANLDEAKLADVEVLECPFPTYDLLREQAPVWRDPLTGMYVITRYEDLRMILLDKKRFSNQRPGNDHAALTGTARKAYEKFLAEGWVPAASLAGRDDPEHKQMRSVFDGAFRASKIKALDVEVERLAYQLMGELVEELHNDPTSTFDFVQRYAVPLPLIVICRQMGANDADIWQIKAWTDAWIKGVGFGLTEDQVMWSTAMEIQAQHYFQPIFEALRKTPNDSLLSDLVNLEVPGWGRTLNDNELHCAMMQDTFVGGSETTTNALSAGIMLLAENPVVWQQLSADPDRYLRNFCEEVLRLESPVQGLTRMTTEEVELHGVRIPKGAILNVRFAAANRDPAQFDCPHQVDLQRNNSAAHLAFSSGTHYCLGAPLARRELYWGFKAFIDHVQSFTLAPHNNLRHAPNYNLRALQSLELSLELAAQPK